MSDRLLLGTRKGLFEMQRLQGSWKITNHALRGEPVSMLWQGQGYWLVALNLGHFGSKLHRSVDEGQRWQEVSVPVYPQTDDRRDDKLDDKVSPSLDLIWSMAADRRGRLWAGTVPGGLFVSDDWGDSWQLNEPLWQQPSRSQWFGGGFDAPGIHSICIDPRNPDWLTVAISCAGVWQSRDGGGSWQVQSKGMWAEYMPPEQRDNPVIQDPHRLVQCAGQPDCFWVQHHNGIFKTEDNCASWQEVKAQPSSFGFAVAVHPQLPQRAWFVPAIKDQFRYPVDGEFVVTRTDDGGQQFTVLRHGLPHQPSYDLVYRHALAVDASGERLALASTTGNLWISDNSGDDWQLVSSFLPPVQVVEFVEH